MRIFGIFTFFSDMDLDNNERVTPARVAGGRPTLPDSYLMDGLYALIDVLEKGWPQIGWDLERIREAPKSPALDKVTKALEPISGWSRNFVVSLLRSPSVKVGTHKDLRDLRLQLGQAVTECTSADSAVRDQRPRYEESSQAIYLSYEQGRRDGTANAELEHQRRKAKLEFLEGTLTAANENRDSLQREMLGREAFLAQNEMLNFLRDKQYELNPRNLARALAGTPYMRWRQSILRCKRINCAMAVSINYQAFQAISWIIRGERPRNASQGVQLFKLMIPKLPTRFNRAQIYLKENWPQLKKAIDECWELCPLTRKLPYELTSSFLRNVATPTNALDRVIAAQERIEL